MLYVRGRHSRTGIIQCEQFSQATVHIETQIPTFLF